MWCDTARYPKLWKVDARAIFPISIWFFDIGSLHAFEIAAAGVVLFSFLLYRGLSPAVAIRKLRRAWSGPIKRTVTRRELRRWSRYL